MSHVRLAIFDLDGTLIEFHREYLFTEAGRILRVMGHSEIPLETLAQSFAAFDFFRFVESKKRDLFVEEFWRHFDWDGFPQAAVISGAREVLEDLQSHGVVITLATARLADEQRLRDDLAHTGLLPYFTAIAGRESESTHWTDKTGHIARISELTGIAPNEAMMIGDIPADIESAKKSGVAVTYAVESGGIARDVLARHTPTAILPDVGHMLATSVRRTWLRQTD